MIVHYIEDIQYVSNSHCSLGPFVVAGSVFHADQIDLGMGY